MDQGIRGHVLQSTIACNPDLVHTDRSPGSSTPGFAVVQRGVGERHEFSSLDPIPVNLPRADKVSTSCVRKEFSPSGHQQHISLRGLGAPPGVHHRLTSGLSIPRKPVLPKGLRGEEAASGASESDQAKQSDGTAHVTRNRSSWHGVCSVK